MPGFELIGEEERKALNDLFDDGGVLSAQGFDKVRSNRYHVREFEKKFADYIGTEYALAVTSGSVALKVALIALGVKPGDEVITQSFTFIAVAEAIIDVGAKPVFVNINETLNMDPNELENAITNKTTAIIPVHMLGVSAEQDKIHKISKKYNIPILDDACESLGAMWGDEKLGAQADIATWSFDGGKTITAGEGGMITTNNKELFLLSKEYHDHGHMNNPKFTRGRDTHRIYGFNYRMTEMQAVIAKVQLNKMDFILKKNRENYYILKNMLSKINGVKFRNVPINSKALCDTLIINLENKQLASKLVNTMKDEGIGTKNVPDAIEWHFAKYWDHMLDKFNLTKTELDDRLQNSSIILERCVAFPIMVNTSQDEMITKSKKIKEIIETL